MSCHLRFDESDFPSCWKDDNRMNVLFSIFRSQSVNLVGWHDKMNFWMFLISELCLKYKAPVISLTTLCSAFERKGKLPQCLDVVLENMASQKTIMSMSEFNAIEQDKGWLGWGFDILVRKPVSWSFASMQSMMNWTKKDERYVIISVVKDLASKIYEKHIASLSSDVVDDIMFLECLQEQSKSICVGESFQLALIQLQREKKICIFEEDGRQIVKFKKRENSKILPLSEVDKGILRLQKAKDAITKEIDKMEEEIQSSNLETRHMVKIGCKSKAMVVLKRKKRLELCLKKKLVEADNIDTLLYQLQNTGTEKMVLDAYKAGVQAMNMTSQEELDLDKIDVTMSEVEEMMDNFAEVQATLAKPVIQEEDSLLEFEDELQDLLQDEEETNVKEEKDKLDDSTDSLIRRLEALNSPPQDDISKVPEASIRQVSKESVS